LYRVTSHVALTYGRSMTYGANYKRGKLHHSSRHSDIRTPKELHIQVLLEARSIIACKCITALARSWPPSIALSGLDLGLQVHVEPRTIAASQCISEYTRYWPPNVCPNLLDNSLLMHLWVHTILVSNCSSKLAQSRPPTTSSKTHHRCTQIQR
jgi:hypothetical protein